MVVPGTDGSMGEDVSVPYHNSNLGQGKPCANRQPEKAALVTVRWVEDR